MGRSAQKILLTGAGGQLGRELQEVEKEFSGFELRPVNREHLDITSREAVRELFTKEPFAACINAAAYTAVDKAESEPEQARQVNVEGPAHLARACAEAGIPLLHFSTDYVFHTRQNFPFRESDPTHPQSVYARTKLDGERAACDLHPGTTIIRTSWVYSSFGHNFVKTMLRLGRERAHLRVVCDQIGTPTYARDLARAALTMLAKAAETPNLKDQLPGIYHCSNEGVCSWYDFALAIFEMSGTDCRVEPIGTKDYPTPAARPPYSVLNKAKIKETFALEIPHWRESLRSCLGKLGQL